MLNADTKAATASQEEKLLFIWPRIEAVRQHAPEASLMDIEMRDVPLKAVLEKIAGIYGVEFRIPAKAADRFVTATFHGVSYRTVVQSVAEQVGLMAEFGAGGIALH
jgi:type II secretory pathway component GspD/PulD (secretin)